VNLPIILRRLRQYLSRPKPWRDRWTGDSSKSPKFRGGQK